MVKLESPCSYQGGKQRLAKEIVDEILKYADNNTVFYDLCCGSGAVFLELFNQGVAPERIHAIDNGGYGYFWQAISDNTFDLNYFDKRIKSLPSIENLHDYLQELSNQPIDEQTLIYDYLLLQAGSFGSKWIGIQDGQWTNNSFRNYWKPTPTSNRRSPVNPMMPMPNTIYSRVELLVNNLSGKLTAKQGNLEDFIIDINKQSNCIVYIDPPYKNTTGFNGIDIENIVAKIRHTVFVSEGYIMPNVTSYIEYGGRRKGNINGVKKKDNVLEILNVFQKG